MTSATPHPLRRLFVAGRKNRFGVDAFGISPHDKHIRHVTLDLVRATGLKPVLSEVHAFQNPSRRGSENSHFHWL